MTLEEFIAMTGGIVKPHEGQVGVWFDGPLTAPENALFIPLNDLGYSPKDGVFRKSLKPNGRSVLKI